MEFEYIEKVTFEVEEHTLKDVRIGGKIYTLKIANRDGRLWLSFYRPDLAENVDANPDTCMSITGDGIRISRHVYRNHDHDGQLYLVRDKDGNVSWEIRYAGDSMFPIEFGAEHWDY